MPRRDVLTQIEIPAPPAAVWATIRDLDRWPEWNPVVTKIGAKLEPGEIVRFTIQLSGPRLPLTARLLVVDADREIRWRGPPQALLGVIVAGEHYIQLEETSEGGTRVAHGETFTGALTPLLWWWLEPLLLRRYAEMNEALRDRVLSTRDAD